MPKNHLLLLLLSFSLFLISGCSPVQVSYDYDQDVDFSTIRSYAWQEARSSDNGLEDNPLLKKRIIASVEAYLGTRGYTRAAPGTADIYLVLHAGVEEKTRVTNWGGGPPMDPWYSPWRGRGGSYYYPDRVEVRTYTQATLIIDMLSPERRELIWRGVGKGLVREYPDPKTMQREVDIYVAEILSRFPPGGGTE
ncbi:DUF4136 domain-containing protein [Desulfogranum mediterraneum]|uniref:DUF4136 domain-containing protein n=1 Tax=Desulfogranum mediterraneum TaxID=160661 RepID=UPI00042483B8|nr:DUF4136 domain-containing protein [Desulfogranum mediterraneum]